LIDGQFGLSATVVGVARAWRSWPGRPGELNAEQSIVLAQGLPDDLTLDELPPLMERLHFAVVGRYGPGIRVCRAPGRVVCALPGGAAGLVFEEALTRVDERTAKRRWRVGGRLVRAGGAGMFELGAAREPARAWVRVERFPSVFLTPWLPRPLRRAYATFHAHVSLAYLALLRAQLAR
jgi:hypothetical protein